MPETFILGSVSKSSKILGCLPNISSNGEWLHRFGVLNVLYVKVAKHRSLFQFCEMFCQDIR